jgi:hypothetical protein
MRFSIVFDDNGTILGASVGDEEADRPTLGAGVNSGYFDISDGLPDDELQQAEESALIDLDVKKHTAARKEADDGPL